jgi:hypothetical protein
MSSANTRAFQARKCPLQQAFNSQPLFLMVFWDTGMKGEKWEQNSAGALRRLLPLEQDLQEVRPLQLHLGWPIILRTPGSLAVTVHFNWLVGFLMGCEVEKDLGPC